MTTRPLDAVQVIGEMTSKVANLPLNTVLVGQAAPRPAAGGAVGEALAASEGVVKMITGATEQRVTTALTVEAKNAELETLRLENQIAEEREQAEERRERRSQGGMAGVMAMMQTMLTTLGSGTKDEVAQLRAELGAVLQRENDARTQALIDEVKQQNVMLGQQIADLTARSIAGGDLVPQEISKVREAYEQLQGLQSLFGGNAAGVAAASGNVQSMLLAQQQKKDWAKFELDIESQKLDLEQRHRRFMEEMASLRRRDEQVDGLLENLAPVLDTIASHYLPGGESPANVATPAPAPPQPLRQPIQLPPEVAIATCPACGGQAPIPLGYGDRHGVCVGCGAVVTARDEPTAEAGGDERAVYEPPVPPLPIDITEHMTAGAGPY